MDEKDKFISISRNDAPEPTDSESTECDTNDNSAENISGRENTDSTDGKINESGGQDSEAQVYSENSNTAEEPAGTAPQYDKFMYEPIGFEEYDRQQAAAQKEAAEKKEKRMRRKNDMIIITLLFLIFIISVVLGVVGIAVGIKDSGSADFTNPSGNVVLYKEPKPEGANDMSNFVDENGRFTTEGVADAVRPCVVEIYTYDDSLHTSLQGTGSGIIISEDGYIVTNAHVLKSDGYHQVITSDDKTFDAKVIGRDAKTDIAIVKISAKNLKAATLGNSDQVLVGEQVMAIGNPAGLSGSVTDGIVSAVNRRIRSDSTGFEMNCIQTNADISPGNSGGALVNMYGQVIGITSSKYVSYEYEGLGFAITINDALPIIEELINQGYVSGRFRIGIQLVDMSSEYNIKAIEKELDFELPEDFKGIYIAEISDDCDIANTDLKAGDFIIAINGKSISTYDELYDTISSMYGAGDYVPASCAHIDEDGEITYYEIKFKLMEDTSGDY